MTQARFELAFEDDKAFDAGSKRERENENRILEPNCKNFLTASAI
jgi:hypothetical protein